MSARANKRNRRKLIAFSFVSLSLTFVCAELLLRVFYPIGYLRPPSGSHDAPAGATLHRTSSIPGLAYELAPNMEKSFRGMEVSTNSAGMRDRNRLRAREPSTFRIALLGDSVTFGYGVEVDDVYARVLERMLNGSERMQGRRFEVLNFAVTGYSTRDEAIVLEHKVISWDVDLAIIGYVWNDPEIDPYQELHRYFHQPKWWQHSHLLRLVAKSKRKLDIIRYGGGNYVRYLHGYPRKWQSVVDAFEDVRMTAEQASLPIVVLVFPEILKDSDWSGYPHRDLHAKIRSLAERNGFYVVDLYDDYATHEPVELRVSEADSHPNRLGHEIAASRLLDFITENQATLLDTSKPRDGQKD